MTRVIIPSYNFSRGNKAGSTAAKLDKPALAALAARVSELIANEGRIGVSEISRAGQ